MAYNGGGSSSFVPLVFGQDHYHYHLVLDVAENLDKPFLQLAILLLNCFRFETKDKSFSTILSETQITLLSYTI